MEWEVLTEGALVLEEVLLNFSRVFVVLYAIWTAPEPSDPWGEIGLLPKSKNNSISSPWQIMIETGAREPARENGLTTKSWEKQSFTVRNRNRKSNADAVQYHPRNTCKNQMERQRRLSRKKIEIHRTGLQNGHGVENSNLWTTGRWRLLLVT